MEEGVMIRPALSTDAAAINAIHIYYVRNTVITFVFNPLTDQETLDKYEAIKKQNLPYLVAVDSNNKVLGYCSASGFRNVKLGYRYTVELSLFCDHEYRGKGIGGKLLSKILSVLREPSKHTEYYSEPREDRSVRNVIACMSIDEKGPKNGLALKEFYERFGFVEVGHLKKVGHKFDRWIDTMYLQLSLW